MATTQRALARWAAAQPAARVVVEAGSHSPWVSRVLEAAGHEVVVANPRRVRLITWNASKRDPVDAEWLARLGRADPALLAPVHHRGPAAQAALSVLRARECLVRARTRVVNQVRGLVKAQGARLPRCSTASFPRRVSPHVPAALQPAVGPALVEIDHLTQQIRAYDQQVAHLATAVFPETARLRQVPGVGPLTALAFVLTLEDPARFPRSRTVGSYLGLRPRLHESGRRRPALRITKEGDAFVRQLLVQAAHYILGPFGPDTRLRDWGLGLVARGGKHAKQRAVIAVARKLAVLLHQLWRTGAVYEPHRAVAGRAA